MIPSAAAIHAHIFAYINAFVLWLNIIAFAVFQGSDSGAGIWYLFASGPLTEHQRESLGSEIAPLWEANETWSVFLVTGIFTTFPAVFYTLVVGLFYPLSIALIGLVFFGAAFEFYKHAPPDRRVRYVWRWIFAIAALLVPFFFGAVAGAVASGDLHYVHGHVTSDYWTTWTQPFALCVGLFAVGICMVLAATFQTVQAKRTNDAALLSAFRQRAIISGAFTALAGAVAAALAIFYAPYLWSNLVGRALPFTLAAVLDGLLVAAALLLGYFRAARALVVTEVALILGAWGIAQFPYFIPPDLTIEGTASPKPTQIVAFVSGIIGIFLFMPAFYYLIYLFQGSSRRARVTADEWAQHSPERAFEWSAVFGGVGEAASPPPTPPAKVKQVASRIKTASGHLARRTMRLAGITAASIAFTVGMSLLQRYRRERIESRERRERILT